VRLLGLELGSGGNALSFVNIGDYLPATCGAISEAEFLCLEDVDLPAVGVGPAGYGEAALLEFNQLVNLNGGPFLGGSFIWAVTPRSSSHLSISSDGFTYGVQGGCEQDAWGSGAGPWPYVGYECWVEAGGGGGRFCEDVAIVQDRLDLFAPVYGHGSPTQGEPVRDFRIHFPVTPEHTDEYFGAHCQNPFWDPACHNRYPVKIVVRSSVGSQCFQMRAPEEGDPTQFEQELFTSQLDCTPPGLDEKDLYISGALDPLWYTDPPPFDQPVDMLLGGSGLPQTGSEQIANPGVSVVDVSSGWTNEGAEVQVQNVAPDVTAPVELDVTAPVELDPCLFGPCGD
jgi:hypothetical protein